MTFLVPVAIYDTDIFVLKNVLPFLCCQHESNDDHDVNNDDGNMGEENSSEVEVDATPSPCDSTLNQKGTTNVELVVASKCSRRTRN